MSGTHDPLVLDAGLLNGSGLLELLGTGGGGVLGLDVGGVDDVGDAGDGGSGDDVDGEQLEVEPILGGLDDLDGAAVGGDAVLLARLLVVDQQAELHRELLRLELGHKVKGICTGRPPTVRSGRDLNVVVVMLRSTRPR